MHDEQRIEQTWVEAYFGLFGRKLAQEEVSVIEASIKSVFGATLKPWEMVKAVRRCAMNAGATVRKYPPTGEDIIRAIKAGRYEYVKQRDAGGGGHSVLRKIGDGRFAVETQSAEEWQRELKSTRTPRHAWDVICRPTTVEQCEERRRFCDLNGVAYDPELNESDARIEIMI